MFASDFLFDSQRASDLGLMICSFNGDFTSVSGGEIEFNSVKTPNRDRFTFYGSQLNSVLEWNFSICKNPCKNDTLYFNQYEESMIAKWLIKTDGYRFLQFDQNGHEDIFYNVCFNITPHQINGRTIGFDLTATSDCGYGFTDVIKRKAVIKSGVDFKLNVHSDINTYVLPLVKIKGTGNFYISNNSDNMQNISLNKESDFKNVSSTKQIIMDSDCDTIYGIDDPKNFNWYFLRLVDGINEIISNSMIDVEIEFQYREPRYVKI